MSNDTLLIMAGDVLTPGYCVEVGAYDGVNFDSTLPFEQLGWTVLCIEPNPFLQEYLVSNRKLVMECACADYTGEATFTILNKDVGCMDSAGSALKPRFDLVDFLGIRYIKNTKKVRVKVRRLDDCLEEAGFPRCDVVCIDCEGGDLDVLRGFTIKRWNPRLVCVENWLDDPEYAKYFSTNGYRRLKRDWPNDYYVPEEAKDGHPEAADRLPAG